MMQTENKKGYIPTDELEVVDLVLAAERRKLNPKAPWKNKRALESEDAAESSTPERLYREILEIDNIRDRCFATILYLCAARIGEITRKKIYKYGKKEVYKITKTKKGRGYVTDYNNKKFLKELPSIRKDDISFTRMNQIDVVMFNIRNEKNQDLKRQRKRITIPLNSEININFVEIIKQYISTLEEFEELFMFEERRGEQILNEEGINPHFLRELRLTHLAKFNNFTDQQLVFFAGWTDSRPSKNYIKMRPEDLINHL